MKTPVELLQYAGTRLVANRSDGVYCGAGFLVELERDGMRLPLEMLVAGRILKVRHDPNVRLYSALVVIDGRTEEVDLLNERVK